MLIDGQCLRPFSIFERTTVQYYDKCPAAIMAQQNGADTFGAEQPALGVSNNDSITKCMASVDELLSKHNELSQQQTAYSEELQTLRREEAQLRTKIQDLEHPLQDVDAVTLTEAELAPIQALQSDAVELNDTGPCDMDAETMTNCSAEICQPLGPVPMECADDRLQPPPDAAQQDPLRSQQEATHGEHSPDAVAQVFGTVPAFTPLPEDPTVAMILSCNRYTSSASHLETFQNMGQLHHAVQGAQHYMSGRHHVMFVKPTTGALWSLPVVQKGLEQHEVQLEDLTTTLAGIEQSQAAEVDVRASGLAVQLAATQPAAAPHDEADPVRVAVREHMHNFSCHIPSQLDERSRWLNTFVDSNRLVADPKQELAFLEEYKQYCWGDAVLLPVHPTIRSWREHASVSCVRARHTLVQLPKFTRPWTKQEKEAMENVLGESGKKFAEVASKVGTRNIAECIDRYYKIHLRDEFKPTWRKMSRLKRATDGRNKRSEESKVLATVTKVARHRYDSLPRQDSVAWRFPPVSDERLRQVPPVTARDFDSNTQLASEDSLRGHSRPNGRKRIISNMLASPVQPFSIEQSAGLDEAADTTSLLSPGGIHLRDLTAGSHSLLTASLPAGAALGPPPLDGLQPLSASASLLPLPDVPISTFPKGGGSVQPSLSFQTSTAAAPPMLRPVANGNLGHTMNLHGGQLQNIVPGDVKAKVHAQPEESDANAEHWQNPC